MLRRTALLAFALFPLAAQAQTDPVPKGTFGDWAVYAYREKGRPVCYAAAKLGAPASGAPRRSGWVLITHRPAEKSRGVVSVLPGYTFKDRSTAVAAVGGKQFTLYTQGDAAWAADTDDPRLVEAIRAAATLTFTGTPREGGALVDHFSLGGAAAAMDALDKSCTGTAATSKKKSKKKK
jgi:Invasion associated locus B (IalB) protein